MLSITVTGIQELLEELPRYPSRISTAMTRALNRAIAAGRTQLVREVARDTGLKSRAVREAMPLIEATPSRLEAALQASNVRPLLSSFKFSGPEPSRGQGRGVTVRMPGGAGRYPNAFIAKMKSGHSGVFVRAATSERKSAGAWSKNLPILQPRGASISRVVEKYRDTAVTKIQDTFEARFDHEMGFKRSGADGAEE